MNSLSRLWNALQGTSGKFIMTPDQQNLVRESFQKVLPINHAAAALFYSRLFELDPKLRPLFKGDIEEQGRKLMSMLAMVVSSIHRLEKLMPAVRDLGRRHSAYGVKDADYEVVAQALLWTLKQGLGPAFTDEAEEAWRSLYSTLATEMKSAAHVQHASMLLPPC